MWDIATGAVAGQFDNANGSRTFSPHGKLMVIAVPIPVKGLLVKSILTPMELRIFQLSNKPVQSETRGEALGPVPVEEKN